MKIASQKIEFAKTDDDPHCCLWTSSTKNVSRRRPWPPTWGKYIDVVVIDNYNNNDYYFENRWEFFDDGTPRTFQLLKIKRV